tara:strand:- start:25857 stop:26132 length:276 start_codon:yes stop_codon:yes gene_type:complete
MSNSTLKKLLDSVEWGPVGTYKTNKGKSKVCRKGIPSALFWRRWKAYKSEFVKLGLTVSWTDTEKVYSRKNGKTANRKLWEVTAWQLSIFN